MLPDGASSQTVTPLLDLLRSTTRTAHANLEARLALLQPPLSRARFVGVLRAFYCFHLVWEPRVEALADDGRILAPRRKLASLKRDLDVLQAAPAPAPQDGSLDLAFLRTPAEAWGSLYVMEGATLGGQVISKALRSAEWAPEGGLHYFNPYGRRTAAMWAQFRNALEARDLDAAAVAHGARSTFKVLEQRLAAGLEIVA